jgi:serine beta-lactamase-like protein LACTB
LFFKFSYFFFFKRYYTRSEKGRLQNVPYVDNSCKWAGGGILSSVGDLMQFGNNLLYSYQNNNPTNYLKQSTIKNFLWSKQSMPVTIRKDKVDKLPLVTPLEKTYCGLGWYMVYNDKDCLKRVYHTGGAVGCSSCLLIVPKDDGNESNPNGIVVAVLCNLDNASGIANFTNEIANIFKE